MKHAVSILAATLVVAALSGCARNRACQVPSNPCPPGFGARGGGGSEAFNPGPPTGAVTYPYYTVRGPRDFFVDDPPSIGP